jgi:hypothetical protein
LNPYDAPKTVSPHGSRGRRYVVVALSTLLTLTAFVVAGPWIIYSTADLSRPTPSATRYATYDPELMLLGYDLSPTLARILACYVAPALLAVAVVLVTLAMRGRNKASADPTDADNHPRTGKMN